MERQPPQVGVEGSILGYAGDAWSWRRQFSQNEGGIAETEGPAGLEQVLWAFLSEGCRLIEVFEARLNANAVDS